MIASTPVFSSEPAISPPTQAVSETKQDYGSCPRCGGKLVRFSYIENSASFPALECVRECGWWQ